MCHNNKFKQYQMGGTNNTANTCNKPYLFYKQTNHTRNLSSVKYYFTQFATARVDRSGYCATSTGATLMLPAMPKARQPLADKGYDADLISRGAREPRAI